MLSGVHCESLRSIWPCLSACCICFLKYWACYNKEFCITLFSWAFACACVWVSSYRGPNSSLSTPRTFCYQSCCCSPLVGNSVYFILIIFSSGLFLCCGIFPCFRFPSLRFTKKANKNEAENGNGSAGLEFVKHFMYLMNPQERLRGRLMEFPTGRETRVECVLETLMFLLSNVLSLFWALRLWVSHEFTATGFQYIKKKIHVWDCFLSHHPLAVEILGWICNNVDILLFYRPFSSSELLSFGIGLGLVPIQARCLLRSLTPTASEWTLHASLVSA